MATIQAIPGAIALFERDGDVLWKHRGDDGSQSRRARQLVIVSYATVGNYDYGFQWIFHQDGTLKHEVFLTGIMSTKAVEKVMTAAAGHDQPQHGHLVADNVAAVHHQHFFNYRLDLDIDWPDGKLAA